MKQLLLVLLFFPMLGWGQQLGWGSYTTISANADGYGRPRIVLTANNYPLIILSADSIFPSSIQFILMPFFSILRKKVICFLAKRWITVLS
mgnify:CR=1 FL=1